MVCKMEEVNERLNLSLSELFRAFEKSLGFKNEIKWVNVISLGLYHIAAAYWCSIYSFPVKWQTVVFAAFLFTYAGFGITGGAHRLWTHKSYKAKLPLKILLLICFSVTGQAVIIKFCYNESQVLFATFVLLSRCAFHLRSGMEDKMLEPYFHGLGKSAKSASVWGTLLLSADMLPVLLVAYLEMDTLHKLSGATQNSLEQWVLDHRVHHKFSDTDADPHNANRGLFFSHIGWLMMKKNNKVLTSGKQIDMTDITDDPLLRFYNKHFMYFKLLFCYILPLYINIHLFGETWQCAVAWQWFIRYLTVLHSELTVNSLAHAYGYKPYNKNIMPRENRFVATCTFGEGWHNYHHAFPFDYKAAEHFDMLNLTTKHIRFFEKIGWAYDLREATPEMINSIAERLGDGTPVHFPIPAKNDVE